MATYVTLINFTDQGIRNWTQGQYDVVSIVDAPDEASMTALAMSVGKLGFVRTQTLRAYSAAELAPIMDKVV